MIIVSRVGEESHRRGFWETGASLPLVPSTVQRGNVEGADVERRRQIKGSLFTPVFSSLLSASMRAASASLWWLL